MFRTIRVRDENGNDSYKSILERKDLLNDADEDLDYIHQHVEETFMVVEGDSSSNDGASDVTVESKYLHSWDDLNLKQKQDAVDKAVAAYDRHDSWHRDSDLDDHAFAKLRKQNPKIIALDCTVVKQAKIKNGKLIGKLRIAPRGFRDRSLKATWHSTSPTVESISVRISELLGMQLGLESWCFDISDAFFSGEELGEDEYIYIKIPKEIDPNSPWRRLKREVPGCKGASSSWFRTFTKKLVSYGWEPLTTDQALFVKRRENGSICGILPVHVDDGKLRADESTAKELFAKLRADPMIELSTVEKQEKGKPIEFTGMTFIETELGEEVNQHVYIRNKLHNIDTRDLKTRDPDGDLEGEDKAMYATNIGRLIWVIPTQLKFSYEIAYLSRYRGYPKNKHMIRLAKLIADIKSDPQHIFLPRFHYGAPLKVISVVDAGAGEEADPPLKTRDHQCVAILLASTPRPNQDHIEPGTELRAGLLSWRTCGLARVSHSSFDFESISAVSSLDLLGNVREVVGEVTISLCPPLRANKGADRQKWRDQLPSCELHSDSMGLVKAVRLGVSGAMSSRRRRDILDLRDSMSHGDIDVFMHVDGPTNFADVGTKTISRTQKAFEVLKDLIHKGVYIPKRSQDHQRQFGAACCYVRNRDA